MKFSRAIPLRHLCLGVILAGMVVGSGPEVMDKPLPRLEQGDGRHVLIVDDEPFLILGAQSNNSSSWPGVLPKVWSAMETFSVNTLEIPIYWEQFEPRPVEYDYSVVDAIIEGARERGLRLVLLWFAT